VKVERSIAEGPVPAPSQAPAGGRATTLLVGVALAVGAFALYALSNPEHANLYNHFVWQADAFLHGRAWFPYPVDATTTQPANWYFQDVYPLLGANGLPDGRVLLPFPPLPAIVLLPFVALFGLFTDQDLIAIGLGAVGVAAAWWSLGALRLGIAVRVVATVVFATGTVWWWAAAVGSTWYLAHLVAVIPALAAVGVALRADPDAEVDHGIEDATDEDPVPNDTPDGDDDVGTDEPEDHPAADGGLWAAVWPLDRSQVVAGLLLGVAATARLPMVLAAPFLMFVGGGGSVLRRTVSAGVGGVLPVGALLLYTYLTTGALVHPGYDYQYRLEVVGYPTLGYHADWAVEDIRYIPQNLGIMLGSLPVIAPDVKPDTLGIEPPQALCTAPGAIRAPFDPDCPLAMPVDIGTSILISAPGLLLALVAIRRRPGARLTVGAVLATLVIATFNLAHFSQGWVQWGYRFSLDFLPFLLPLVAIGASRARPVGGSPSRIAVLLVVVGAAVNLWGVAWGQLLGW
jgi:hypothetical protein